MVGEILAGAASFNAMFNLAKNLKEAKIRNSVAIELQEKILAAQKQQAALVETISQLKAEVVRLKNWDADKKRYELQEIAPGRTAYCVKEAMRGAEPVHWLCPNCYQQGQKAILQPKPMARGIVTQGCPRCAAEISYHG